MADITGSAAGEMLAGGASDDTIVGGGGADQIYGGPGNDTLTGGDDPDVIDGESGDDVIDGGGGADTLRGGAGDDIVHGGDGNDYIFTDEPGSDELYGDAGDDEIEISRATGGSNVSVFAGDGVDYVLVDKLAAGNTLTIDTGDDFDWVQFSGLASSPTLTLGAGRDVIDGQLDITGMGNAGVHLLVTDWEAGANGDMLNVFDLLNFRTSWDPSTNPFTAGYLHLAQSGSDVILSASATANGVFKDLVVFQNASLGAFTAENFGGYSSTGPSRRRATWSAATR